MNNFLKTIIAYARLKELRPAWIFGVIALFSAIAAWNAFHWTIAAGVSATLLAYFLFSIWNGIAMAKTNFSLRLEKNQNSAIIAGFSEGVIAYDQHFQIMSVNQAMEAIMGIRKDEVLGKSVGPEWAGNPRYKILAQIMFPSLAPTVVKKTLTGYPQQVDVTLQEPREMHLEITTNQIFDESGKLIGFIKVVRDRSREVALLRSKSEFISVAAHQMRTPLSGIRWALDAMRKEQFGALSPEQKQIIEQSFSTVEKLTKLLEDLLNVAKIEEGKFGYTFEKIDIMTVIKETLGSLLPNAESRGVRLILYPPTEPLPLLLIDRQKIFIALQNIVDNGIKYNVKNGEVRVKVQKLNDRPYVEIDIEDTGIGMPASEAAKVFTKFFRGEAATKIETEGSGLGLYIAKNIIMRHGGDIWVKSVEKRGTTFSLILPTEESLIPPVEIPVSEAS